MKLGKKSLAIVLLLAGLVLVNYLASSLPFRYDATAEKVYTLSPGTKSLLAKVEEPVTLELFFSRSSQSLPINYKNFASRIQEMLRQYVRASGGKLKLKVTDPLPDSPDEERAVAAGLQPQMLQTGEKVTFGLVATQADQQKVIEVFNPQRESFLEYDISQLIYSVQQVDKKKMGLISSLPIKAPMDFMAMQQGRRPQQQNQVVLGEWEKAYSVQTIDSSVTELPAGLDVLVVVHPQNLSPQLQYAIDQFLLSGKPVLIAVDPASQYFKRRSQGGMYGAQPQGVSSDLSRLFRAYGISYDPTMEVCDPSRAMKVQTGAGSVVNYPIWLGLDKSNLSKEAQPTAQLSSLMFIEAGSISKAVGSDLNFTPLIESTAQAGELNTQIAQFAQPEELAGQIASPSKKTIAALVSGTFKTAFPEGAPKADNAAKEETKDKPAEKPAAPALKSGKSMLIVIADTDWLLDDYSVRRMNFMGVQAAEPLNDNLFLGSNLVDFLGGSSDLVSIRGKGNSQRPFLLVRDMENAAQKKYQEQLSSVEAKLSEVQNKLSQIQAKQGNTRSLIATPEVQKAVEEFKKQEAEARRERREIRRALREDIDALERRLIAINLLASPLLVGLFGVWFYRSRRR